MCVCVCAWAGVEGWGQLGAALRRKARIGLPHARGTYMHMVTLASNKSVWEQFTPLGAWGDGGPEGSVLLCNQHWSGREGIWVRTQMQCLSPLPSCPRAPPSSYFLSSESLASGALLTWRDGPAHIS